jgi:hypothetical protein
LSLFAENIKKIVTLEKFAYFRPGFGSGSAFVAFVRIRIRNNGKMTQIKHFITHSVHIFSNINHTESNEQDISTFL